MSTKTSGKSDLSISARLANGYRKETLEELKKLDEKFRKDAKEEFERLSQARNVK